MNIESLSRLVESIDLQSLLPRREGSKAMLAVDSTKLLGSLALSPSVFVAVVENSHGEIFGCPLSIDDGVIRRALPGESAAELLLKAEPKPEEGSFILTRWHSEPALGERAIGVDQTEESIVVGERAILKWLTRPTPRANSCLPRIEALLQAGFTAMPTPWLSLEWQCDQESEPLLLAYATSFIAHAEDGWTWATNDLQSFLDGRTDLRESTSFATIIGKMTAEMHAALTSHDSSRAKDGDINSWTSATLNDLHEAAAVTPGPEGNRLRILEPRIRDLINRLDISSHPKMGLIHGDLHVGQILRSVDGTYSIIDFDGNPVEDASSNAQPVARDLAGILQSIDHVGRVIEKRVDFQFLTEIQYWITTAQAKFRAAYEEVLGEDTEEFDDDLLLLFQIQQECREFLYANRHLPHWIYVPDRALPALIEGI